MISATLFAILTILMLAVKLVHVFASPFIYHSKEDEDKWRKSRLRMIMNPIWQVSKFIDLYLIFTLYRAQAILVKQGAWGKTVLILAYLNTATYAYYIAVYTKNL